MNALLIDHLLESTLFAMLIGFLTLCFASNRAAVRHGLWFAASIKFLIPFSLMVAAGESLRETAPAVALDLPWSVPVDVSDLQLPPNLADMSAPYLAAPRAAALAAVEHMASGPKLESRPLESWDLASVLVVVWLAGMVLLLCRWTLQWLRLHAVRKASAPAQIDLPIPVRLSRMLFEPGLVGIFRPVLLLPEGIDAQLSHAQLFLVIEHELCHWRRRDNLTAAVHMAVELVFWFHPLVWWIGARLVAERERACDESVLTNCDDPKAYADSILEVCRFYVRSPLACAPGVAGANLKHRVARIMEDAASARLGPVKFLLLASVTAGQLLLPMASGLLTPPAAAAQGQPDISSASMTKTLLRPVGKSAQWDPPPPRRKALPAFKVATRALTPEGFAATDIPNLAEEISLPSITQEEQIAAASIIGQTETPAPPAISPPRSSPIEEIIVSGNRIRAYVRTRNFVRNYTAPSAFLDQISRWNAPLCVSTVGLAPGYNAFVTARLKEIAAQIDAPQVRSESCDVNLTIVFTEHPQELLDYIRTDRPDLLGPHYAKLRQKLATVSHPVQAWYATGTRDSRGRYQLDQYDAWWGAIGNEGPPVYYTWGSRLRSGLSSEFASVVIVADIAKVKDREIGTVADYMAMMAFARAKTIDKCQPLPSISNVLADCRDDVRTTALSDYDMAYLKALYRTPSDAPRGAQESSIGFYMQKILETQVAAQKAAVVK